jgi:hypothetical protein
MTSVPLMTLWDNKESLLGRLGFGAAADTWAGFRTERTELLDALEWVPKYAPSYHFCVRCFIDVIPGSVIVLSGVSIRC